MNESEAQFETILELEKAQQLSKQELKGLDYARKDGQLYRLDWDMSGQKVYYLKVEE